MSSASGSERDGSDLSDGDRDWDRSAGSGSAVNEEPVMTDYVDDRSDTPPSKQNTLGVADTDPNPDNTSEQNALVRYASNSHINPSSPRDSSVGGKEQLTAPYPPVSTQSMDLPKARHKDQGLLSSGKPITRVSGALTPASAADTGQQLTASRIPEPGAQSAQGSSFWKAHRDRLFDWGKRATGKDTAEQNTTAAPSANNALALARKEGRSLSPSNAQGLDGSQASSQGNTTRGLIPLQRIDQFATVDPPEEYDGFVPPDFNRRYDSKARPGLRKHFRESGDQSVYGGSMSNDPLASAVQSVFSLVHQGLRNDARWSFTKYPRTQSARFAPTERSYDNRPLSVLVTVTIHLNPQGMGSMRHGQRPYSTGSAFSAPFGYGDGAPISGRTPIQAQPAVIRDATA